MHPNRILDGLDPEQRLVATALEGPVVVLAGAGTGKTRAMTHRIAYGVATGAFAANAVLALTFTTRAAGELRGRLRRLGVPAVQARTFHSAALRQAQYFWPRAYGSELPAVEANKAGLVAAALRRERLAPDTALLRDTAAEIGWAKVSNVAPGEYAAVSAQRGRTVAGLAPDQVGRVFAHYEAVKATRGVIDFDDILLCTAGLLADHPEVAGEVRRTYRHFVVDEYQDVSPLQQALLDLWRGDSEELCVVGDPAQTIHTFAGAQASFLTGFHRRHPRATRIELVRDYRSTPQVVDLANRVMAGQGPRVELRAQRPPGPEPILTMATSEAGEAADVAAWLTGLHRRGTPWNEMAVLYRIHAQSPPLEAALADAGIPFVTRGSEGFFERAEVRVALRALGAAARTTDDPAADALHTVLAGLGWTPEPPAGQGAVRERWESWDALAGLGTEFAAEHPAATAQDLLEELDARARAQHSPDGQGVTLGTLHAAKGLEWDAVALVGAHEGSLPFVLATRPDDIAEERRLFYVGITRAREHLRISGSTSRKGTGARRSPTRFLDGLVAVPTEGSASGAGRRRRGSAQSRTCRVCDRPLGSGAERKLGRHSDCPSTYDEALWEDLRAWRKAEADAAGVPAFVVFTDATLLAVAEQVPANRDDLAGIGGIGPAKLARYGDGLLEVLTRHR
ncbi:ATP-dependent DNA helicase UvrD2 [Propioniciclava sp.]|uniref:ATP-dependent DNA helicase UvrD2 n=1 Tax=Propioniciclava sp. TaxID=2038686 RepID=UPI002616215E|nr:ATP-dependent DNA helicase UvrD2 [Propioniciclava sp.]